MCGMCFKYSFGLLILVVDFLLFGLYSSEFFLEVVYIEIFVFILVFFNFKIFIFEMLYFLSNYI